MRTVVTAYVVTGAKNRFPFEKKGEDCGNLGRQNDKRARVQKSRVAGRQGE
jgi:hypothetical protein